MFPVHRHMDPYYKTFPHQGEPNSYPCQYNPGWGVMPSQMKTDPFRHPSVFVPPLNDNICHSYTGDHSGCCHHSCPPSYYNLRPQFSHVQPPPQMYCYGPYPPYPDAYPAYFIPPQHYSVDQARYDYDKVQNHCCGCPKHTCHRRDDRSLVTEEQKPEKVQDRDSTGLIRLPNNPSPVVWVPTSSIKGRGGDVASQLQPGFRNGWVPLDADHLDGGKKKQSNFPIIWMPDENSQAQKQSNFPIIWMPGYDIAEGAGKELTEIMPKYVDDWQSKFKIVPLKFLENGNHEDRPKAAQEEPSNQIHTEAPVVKESVIKTIPVMEMEERTQKKTSMLKQEEKVDEKKAASCVKQKEESEVSKASEKKQSSPGRSSKLPPVCLRVDPLPRKKTSNGASMSPSPQGLKDKRNHQHNEEKSPRKESGYEISEKVIPILDVKDDSLSQEEKQQKFHKNIPVACSEESMESLVQETAKRENSLKAHDLIEGSELGGKKDIEGKKFVETEDEQKTVVDNGRTESLENKEVREREGIKRVLSQTDAAVIIQSAYRGFEMRKCQPLQKLQKIAKIREETVRIRGQVQSIEASPEALDAKQRMVIGETIMNLLLQLDTIQGLHPSVKDVRKTVARELVCLQEKLDSLGSRIAEEHEPAKVGEDTKAKDGEAAFVSSSAATLEQESCQEKLDSLGSRIAEEHELANAEEEMKAIDGEAAFVSSSADTLEQESFKHDALEDENNSIVNVAKPAELDVKIIDLPSNDEVTLVPSPSSLCEAAPMPESMQPAENKLLSEKLDRPDSEGGAASQTLPSEPSSEDDAKLTLVTEPASGQGVVLLKEEPASEQWTTFSVVTDPASGEGIGQSAKQYSTSESLSTGSQESDSWEKGHEDMSRGKANEAELNASSNVPSLEIGYEERETAPIDPKVEEYANVYHKLEKPQTRALEKDKDSNLREIMCAKTEEVKMALDAEPVVCNADENRSQPEAVLSVEQKADKQNVLEDLPSPLVVDDVCDFSLQSVDGDATFSGHVRSPKLDVEIDNGKERVSENLQVPATKNKIFSSGASNEENQLNVSVEEIGHPTRDVLPTDADAISDGGYTLVEGRESCALDLNEDPYSPPTPTLGGMSKESKNPDQSSADMNKEERKLLEENEKLREMLEKLLEAGKEQLGAISNLNGRVKHLERKLAQKKKKNKKGAKVKVSG